MTVHLDELIFNKRIGLRCPSCKKNQRTTTFRDMFFEERQIAQCEACLVVRELYCFIEDINFCGDDDPFVKLVIANWGDIRNGHLKNACYFRVDTRKRNSDTTEAIHFFEQVDNGCCPNVAKVLYDIISHFKKSSRMAVEFRVDLYGVLKIYQGKDGSMFVKTEDCNGEVLSGSGELLFYESHEFYPHLMELIKAGLTDMQRPV